jgi:RNA 3'-terminal phosphate cyclase (ATP)
MALAGGGRFTTVKPSRHTVTAAEVIDHFLGIGVAIEPARDGCHLVTVGGG